MALILISACGRSSDSGRVVDTEIWTDGDFGEWEAVPPAALDPFGDVPAGAAVDFGAIRLLDDARFIHLQLDVGMTVNAQGMLGSLEILLDTDGTAGTGVSTEDLRGVDLVVVLSRPGAEPGGYGAGVGIRSMTEAGLGPVTSAKGIGLLVAPTHSSDRFEVRLRRGASADGQAQLTARAGGQIHGVVRYVRGGETLDRIGPFTHAVGTEAEAGDPTLPLDSLNKPDRTFRVLTWNVSDDFFRAKEPAFQRVLGALSPDVVLLDEVFEEIRPADLDGFFAGISRHSSQGWSWWLAGGGGPQRTVVASRGAPVSGESALARIDYGPSTLAGWAQAAGGSEAALRKAEVEGAAGLSATGAWIEIEGVSILFVPVDLQSRGRDGSAEDRLRELQAATLNGALAQLLVGREDVGVVIGGDLNLVGSREPLRVLAAGLDVGGRDLDVATPLNWMDRSLTTWRSVGNADDFSPGRLDHVLFRGSRLEVAKAFVFDAEQLSAADLALLGLDVGDTRETSDHLPVVVDFRVR